MYTSNVHKTLHLLGFLSTLFSRKQEVNRYRNDLYTTTNTSLNKIQGGSMFVIELLQYIK